MGEPHAQFDRHPPRDFPRILHEPFIPVVGDVADPVERAFVVTVQISIQQIGIRFAKRASNRSYCDSRAVHYAYSGDVNGDSDDVNKVGAKRRWHLE
jgi:hypothetical protein